VGPGAIVAVGWDRQPFSVTAKAVSDEEVFFPHPLSCVEILGRTVLERTIDRLVRADAEDVSVLVAAEAAGGVPPISGKWKNVRVYAVLDFASAIKRQMREFSRNGIEHSFVMSADVYAETDLLDLFYFHREAKQAATRACDREGPMDLWVVNCERAQSTDPVSLLTRQVASPSYFVREYVRRLSHPGDLRQFAVDVLQNRCAVRPSGCEVKPGVWVDEGAEVHRKARIVAPAYIGRGSKVRQDALVTRGSNIEKDCCIECGTVVEDSSILSNTHVGIWLDVCHAIAAGSLFLSLNRDVALEISDAALIRVNSTSRKTKENERGLMQWDDVQEEVVSDTQQVVALQPLETHVEKSPAPEAWQFGTNLIQG
jgi:NDP-sugar pyrophosphorylase family protein